MLISSPIVAKLQSGGVAGAYEEIKEQVGDLKENLLGKISEYLIPTVLDMPNGHGALP